MIMKLLAYLNLRGVLTCETGLLIGGTETFGIGGIDKLMIRESFRGNRPYIPGSSLKGKMRNLMERQNDLIKPNDPKVHSCGKSTCPVCRVFGSAAENAETITRLIVRDARLIASEDDAPQHTREELKAYLESVRDYQEHSGGYTEVKTENVINRIKGSADKPRHFQRVPAGMKFAIDLSYRVFAENCSASTNIDMKYFREVIQALQLLTQDYLGASGSRGYGRVSFSYLRCGLLDASSLQELWHKDNVDTSSWKPSDEKELGEMLAKLELSGVGQGEIDPSQATPIEAVMTDSEPVAGV